MNTSQNSNRAKSRSSQAINAPVSTAAQPFSTEKEFRAAIQTIRQAYNANPTLSSGELIGWLLDRFGLSKGIVPESLTPELVTVVSAYLTMHTPQTSSLGVLADLAFARLQIQILQAKLEEAEQDLNHAREETIECRIMARLFSKEVCQWEMGHNLKRHDN